MCFGGSFRRSCARICAGFLNQKILKEKGSTLVPPRRVLAPWLRDGPAAVLGICAEYGSGHIRHQNVNAWLGKTPKFDAGMTQLKYMITEWKKSLSGSALGLV